MTPSGEVKWKIDWRGNIVPSTAHVPSTSPIFGTPVDAQAYIRKSPVRVWAMV